MNVQLHPDIDSLDKESLCYSIYSQLYHNFFNAQQKKDDDHPYGVEEGDETSIRLKNTAYGFASAIAGAVVGEGDPAGFMTMSMVRETLTPGVHGWEWTSTSISGRKKHGQSV